MPANVGEALWARREAERALFIAQQEISKLRVDVELLTNAVRLAATVVGPAYKCRKFRAREKDCVRTERAWEAIQAVLQLPDALPGDES